MLRQLLPRDLLQYERHGKGNCSACPWPPMSDSVCDTCTRPLHLTCSSMAGRVTCGQCAGMETTIASMHLRGADSWAASADGLPGSNAALDSALRLHTSLHTSMPMPASGAMEPLPQPPSSGAIEGGPFLGRGSLSHRPMGDATSPRAGADGSRSSFAAVQQSSKAHAHGVALGAAPRAAAAAATTVAGVTCAPCASSAMLTAPAWAPSAAGAAAGVVSEGSNGIVTLQNTRAAVLVTRNGSSTRNGGAAVVGLQAGHRGANGGASALAQPNCEEAAASAGGAAAGASSGVRGPQLVERHGVGSARAGGGPSTCTLNTGAIEA